MVKYNEKTNAFESKYKTFSLCDVTEAQVFMWVKTGELSFGDFLVWHSTQEARDLHYKILVEESTALYSREEIK